MGNMVPRRSKASEQEQIPVGSIEVAPDVCAARAIGSPGLLHKGAPYGDAINLSSSLGVPSAHNHGPQQHILVAVVDLLRAKAMPSDGPEPVSCPEPDCQACKLLVR